MTGSSASANTQPIKVNTLSSQITRHGGMTIVNSPKGVTMAWEAPANMNVAETSRYMGVNNLRHEVTTDTATGETTSVAYTELTHEEYEAYRHSSQGRSLELPPQPAEKMGNTIGTITLVPAPSGKRAEYANPPEKEPPQSNEKPNEQLQALIDQNNDKRSLWQKTKDGTASAWDSTKRIANASWENPGEFGKGLAKGIGNLPSDLANLAVEGAKNGFGSPLSLNNYSKLLDYQAINAYEAGNIASANALASRANSIREFGQVGDIFEITNDAQKGGSFASIFVPLGTLVKAPAAAAKGMRAAKTVNAAADTTKAADVVSDVAKAPEPKGPEGTGTGGKIKQKIKSLRRQYLGKTPGKNSKTGREVQDRMREEGKLRENIDTGRTEFQASDGRWYDISKADMSHHPKDAVSWWNETGRQHGAKSTEVRAWMRDSNNYTLDHYSLNRSAGAKLTETYLPPLK